MQTKTLEYNGAQLRYRTTGEGPVVMLLHGFGEDGSVWRNQFSLLAGCRLLVPDLPGSGQSEALPDLSMDAMAGAVYAIAAVESKAPFCLIGHSMGGYIALAFAEKYPHRLNGLGLFHSTAFADTEAKKETRRKGIAFLQQHGAEAFLRSVTANLFAKASQAEHPEWIDEQLVPARNFSAAVLVQYYEAMMARPDRTAVLLNSTVPVLFVMGEEDSAIPLADGLKQCHLPRQAYIHLLRRSGHMGMLEEREETNKILSQFVTAVVAA